MLRLQESNEEGFLMCHGDGGIKSKKIEVHIKCLEQSKKVHIRYALKKARRVWKVP